MKGEKIFSYLLVAASLCMLIGSLLIEPMNKLTVTSPAGYPILISALCLLLAFVVSLKTENNPAAEAEKRTIFDPVIVNFFVMLTLYVVGIMFIHYTLATLIFLFAAMASLSRKDWRRAILISYIGTFMILLVFKYLFSVILP